MPSGTSGLEFAAATSAAPEPLPSEQPAVGGASKRPEQAKRELAERLAPRIIDTRNRRRSLDEEDLNAFYMQSGKRVRFHYDSDTFKHYIPAGRRAIERCVTRVVQMLVPSSNFFECFPGDELSLAAGKQAESVGSFMDWLCAVKIGIRDLAEQAVRSLLLYRRAIVKTSVRVTDAKIAMGRLKSQVTEVWPTAYVVDPFSFFVWPETVTDPEDAVLVFEDVQMPYQDYKDQADSGFCDQISPTELTAPEWPHYQTARLSSQGLTTPDAQATAAPDGKVAAPSQSFVALTECWFKGNSGQWMVAWLVWNVAGGYRIVRLKQGDYARIPYRVAIARPMPGQFYTSSLAQDVEALQILLNDQFNQGEEARSVAALPPMGMDTSLVSRHDSIQYGARKVWLSDGDPAKSFKVLDIPDTSGTSQRAAQMSLGLINSIGGSSPLAEGQPTRGMPRGSQAAQNLLNLGMSDYAIWAQIIEDKILTPLLADLHLLTVAFVPESQLIQIPGAAGYRPQTITVQELLGNWRFRWVGSQQQQQLTAKGQQMLVFFQGLTRAAPVLQQQGWAINWGPLVKRVWRDTLGERGLEEIIVPISELANVNPAAADSLKQAQELQQVQAAAASHPKTNVTIKGEIDPLVSKSLATGQQVPPGPPGPTPAAARASGQPRMGKMGPAGPANLGDVLSRLSQVTAERSPAQMLGGA